MNPTDLKKLLEDLSAGRLSVSEVIDRLAVLPFEDVGVAMIDHHRELRQGTPEVILGESKTIAQLRAIINGMLKRGSNVLATRLDAEKAETLLAVYPEGRYDAEARTLAVICNPPEIRGHGKILVICAGTSDLPVAREAAVVARFLGHEVEELADVGVAGLHRLLDKLDLIRQAAVIIVVAGMEGALPSVVGGLAAAPVIAVPTSVGYGVSFGGIAALLGMLNSCASGVTVVNIDNGFGAACAAARINQRKCFQ
ncbi:MAG: nickel pincer cofactor biosynthesis protein LarB [Syntrophotaleaceae bacterium]